MEVGHIYKACITCGKVKKSEDFEIEVALEDMEDEDPFHVNKECKQCYDYGITIRNKNRVRDSMRGNSLLIQKRVDFIYKDPQEEVSIDVRCPKCGMRGRNRCGCYDVDSDGYR